ncbi:MAG TPA: squalene/phytoene synthase family protein [Candidatus Ruania gallistercoris]|uniref:Squalene/phytoene synthase family protein n=1 Tax=Candidatus Ruania gallistercoris TaxID=2838746 RepID=A0A9D2EDA8_9MICO|nr:squalene/phytoene synthase family protein [Candidatus Ruania gallistercoris]
MNPRRYRNAVPPGGTATDPLYDRVAQRSAGAVITGYSTSFAWACRLLAEPVRTQVRSIYALVRVADELVDGPAAAATEHAADLLDELEEQTLDAVRSGHSTNLVTHAFALTARSVGIGPELITPFFASMRTDLRTTGHDQRSFDEYVYGSAEVVGLMCLRAFLAAPDAATAPSYDALSPGARSLGAAFQKVNFLRDLGADLDLRGRSYFPGLDVDRLTPEQRDALVDDIDADLARAQRAIAGLPRSSRRAVTAAHRIFAALSHRLRALPPGELRRTRVRVPAASKGWILMRSYAAGGRT